MAQKRSSFGPLFVCFLTKAAAGITSLYEDIHEMTRTWEYNNCVRFISKRQYKSFANVYVSEAPAVYNFHTNNTPGLLGKQKLQDALCFLVHREYNATAKN
jgi:hypothetical protein